MQPKPMNEIIKQVQTGLQTKEITALSLGHKPLSKNDDAWDRLVSVIEVEFNVDIDKTDGLEKWLHHRYALMIEKGLTDFELASILKRIPNIEKGYGIKFDSLIGTKGLFDMEQFQLYTTKWKLREIDLCRLRGGNTDKYYDMQKMQNIETGDLYWYFGDKVAPFEGFQEKNIWDYDPMVSTKSVDGHLSTSVISDKKLDELKAQSDEIYDEVNTKLKIKKVEKENKYLLGLNKEYYEENRKLQDKQLMNIEIRLTYSEQKQIKKYMYDNNMGLRRLYILSLKYNASPPHDFNDESVRMSVNVTCDVSELNEIQNKTYDNHFISESDYLRNLILNFIR